MQAQEEKEEEEEEEKEEEEGIMNVKVKVYELKVFPVSCFVFMWKAPTVYGILVKDCSSGHFTEKAV